MASKQKHDELNFNIYVNLKGIINFNSNLGENGPWGLYSNPFHADQFVTPPGDGELIPLDGIPTFPADRIINLMVVPDRDMLIEQYNYDVEYMKLSLIGPVEFSHSSPRHLWNQVLDIEKTDGAIGSESAFYVSQTNHTGKFRIITSPDLSLLSYNMLYQVCFSFKLNGITKYCTIDPLIKTSSADRG